mgnify:CR=1 FL=1
MCISLMGMAVGKDRFQRMQCECLCYEYFFNRVCCAMSQGAGVHFSHGHGCGQGPLLRGCSVSVSGMLFHVPDCLPVQRLALWRASS